MKKLHRREAEGRKRVKALGQKGAIESLDWRSIASTPPQPQVPHLGERSTSQAVLSSGDRPFNGCKACVLTGLQNCQHPAPLLCHLSAYPGRSQVRVSVVVTRRSCTRRLPDTPWPGRRRRSLASLASPLCPPRLSASPPSIPAALTRAKRSALALATLSAPRRPGAWGSRTRVLLVLPAPQGPAGSPGPILARRGLAAPPPQPLSPSPGRVRGAAGSRVWRGCPTGELVLCLVHTIAFILPRTLRNEEIIREGETEAQRGDNTRPRSHCELSPQNSSVVSIRKHLPEAPSPASVSLALRAIHFTEGKIKALRVVPAAQRPLTLTSPSPNPNKSTNHQPSGFAQFCSISCLNGTGPDPLQVLRKCSCNQ
ncbi:uncharacterized protein [Macaca nemestrina]|uniref:uncharacterized protein n=1 Tax=Macaca nemestrina TaxID=9545 RepID=UPI0039B989F5